jgi:hypothetical protein
VLVVHAYNPSYSGGRDQEDHGSKLGQANTLQDLISKKLNTKKDWWSSWGPEFKPQNCKKKERKKERKKIPYRDKGYSSVAKHLRSMCTTLVQSPEHMQERHLLEDRIIQSIWNQRKACLNSKCSMSSPSIYVH